MQESQPEPFVVTIVPASPTEETTVADVIVGAFGIAGLLAILALALGVVFAALRLNWNRRHPPSDDHPPSVTPVVAEPTTPPSSRARSTS